MFKWLKDLFKPIDCYCQCHFDGYQPYAVYRGIRQISCDHCCKHLKIRKKSFKWGTAFE